MQKVQDDVKELLLQIQKDILEKFSINEANDLYFPTLDLNSDLKKFEKDNWFLVEVEAHFSKFYKGKLCGKKEIKKFSI